MDEKKLRSLTKHVKKALLLFITLIHYYIWSVER